jgi:hypothetical protein
MADVARLAAVSGNQRTSDVAVMAVLCVALFLAPQRHYVRAFTTGALRG